MGPKGILVDSDLLALQGQLGTKEIQVIRGSLVKQVLERGEWSFFVELFSPQPENSSVKFLDQSRLRLTKV